MWWTPCYSKTPYDLSYDWRDKEGKKSRGEQAQWYSIDQAVPIEERRSTLQLIAGRGMMVSGQVIAAKQATATISDLKNGGNIIPKSAISIRYARGHIRGEDKDRSVHIIKINNDTRHHKGTLPDNYPFWRHDPHDILTEEPNKLTGIHPIWVSVDVPMHTPQGTYRGTLQVDNFSFPVELVVTAFTVPESSEFMGHLGFMLEL